MTYAQTQEMDVEVEMRWERLLSILSLGRPHGSENEAVFIEEFLAPYNPSPLHSTDGTTLAYVIDIGESKTLFSCHIDTVGTAEDKSLTMDGSILGVEKSNSCLGADDGAGVWLLLEMIDAGVPGCYVFHRGEERGGIGSSGIAKEFSGFLAQFNRAIAFDRRGTSSVITHQGWSRCCSTEFGEALAEGLSAVIDEQYFFATDDGGIFTDTANYTDDIGECTNVSCGYDSEHSHHETLDAEFLFALRDACVALDWESLPTVRKPGDIDPDDWSNTFSYTRAPMTQRQWDYEFDYYKSRDKLAVSDLADFDYAELVDWVEASEPEDIAEVLYDLLQRS